MRLDFNVLWVDDQPERITAQITRIAKQMEDEGFLFRPRHCKTAGEVQNLVGQDVFADEIDLILVDWDLGSGVEGQDIIASIRETVLYKDIVFYSSNKPVDELRRLAFDEDAEGVYCASREGLVEEVLGVFESLVKKVLDLDHTRGIVMGATTDIDVTVNQCLTCIEEQADDAAKQALLAEALGLVEQKLKEATETVTKLRVAKSLGELFEAHLVFTAYDRLRILARVLKQATFAEHAKYRKSVTEYQNSVVPKRNTLGHVARTRQGDAYVLVDNKGVAMTLDDTRALRRLILGLRSDFGELLAALKGKGKAPILPDSAGGTSAE